MIFSKESAVQQVNNLLHLYNKLQICTMDETQVVLTGPILVNRSSKGFQVCKEYSVKIVIPLESEELPYVLDAGNHIDSNYPHRYLSGKLCLETDANIKIRFIDGFFLEAWMIEYVEPYYFSYEFFQRYGEFPFGERGHDWEGIIQTYSDYFNEPDVVKAPPHNSLAALAMPFPPSAACRNLDLHPVNLRFLQLHLTKNSFAIAPIHLCGVALKQLN